MRGHHLMRQRGVFPLAIYAARELRKYLAGAHSDIPHPDAAKVFHDLLVKLREELRTDEELAKEEAA